MNEIQRNRVIYSRKTIITVYAHHIESNSTILRLQSCDNVSNAVTIILNLYLYYQISVLYLIRSKLRVI
jgi:hypothetical protein